MSTIFDLDNALVYYVDRILPNKPAGGFSDIISVINAGEVQLALSGARGNIVYNPSPNDPSLPSTSQSFFGADYENDTDGTLMENFDETYTETASFSLSFTEGIKVGAKTTLTTKIPFVAEGKVELSAEGSFSSTQNDTSSQTQSYRIAQTVPVLPRKRVLVTVFIDSLKYAGTLTAKVQVTGRVFINFGSTHLRMDVADILKAIKNQPPGDYRKTDSRTTYSFTDSDLARFEVTPKNELLYTSTAAFEAKYATRVRAMARQFDLESNLMEREFTV